MEKEIIRYLKSKPKGSADSSEIINNLPSKVSNEEYDRTIEVLYAQGHIIKPHKQSRSGSEPKYDFIKLSEEGKK
jgi:hypothetical protein